MPPRIAPQAHLQRLILFALAGGPAPSVVALANRTGSTRPAVSRSLKALAEVGLVESRGRSWSLTTDGRAEVATRPSPFTAGVQRAFMRQASVDSHLGLTVSATARNLIGPGPGIADMNKALNSGIGRHATQAVELAAKAASAQFDSGIGRHATQAVELAAKAASAQFDSGIGRHATQAVELAAKAASLPQAAVFDSLQIQMSALAMPPGWWTSMVADNLSITARMAADVATMRDALCFPPGILNARSVDIQRAAGRVVRAHHNYLASSLERLVAGPPIPEAAAMIVTPTVTSAAFTATARGMIVPQPPRPDSADLLRAAVWDLATELEGVGAQAAARDLRAAWDVVKRRRPGWSKAGSHLMRETIREALDELASPAKVPRDQNGYVTKRAQVLWIVGGNATLEVFVDVTASNVAKLHSVLSAEAKNTNDPRVGWQGLVGLLETTMGLLRILADHAARRRS